MLPQTELTIFSNQINLTLLSDIITFVWNTSGATFRQKQDLSENCFLLNAASDSLAFQKKYNFLYLGELLERYEDRFGSSIQDFRAIALALGYTRDIVTESMFIGSQRADFIQKLTRQADGDTYLTGALYLLNQDDKKGAALESKLVQEYDAVEELIFVISLLQDKADTFSRFKEQLLRLLGRERTLPVLGNMKLLNWFITWLIPQVKAVRGKDLSLFRALTTLPTSFVRAGSKSHSVLLEYGYTPLEIAYANMMTVLSQTADGALGLEAVATQKIVVSLFQEALGHRDALPPEVCDLLSEVYKKYRRFRIRCYGCETLAEALNTAPHISNPETLLWFSKLTGIFHPALNGFDILDAKWDVLASSMELETYQKLFELGLSDSLGTEAIQRRIDRYDTLTGTNYLCAYQSRHGGSHFGLLVKKGIIDLWQEFQNSLDSEGSITRPDTVERIRDYLYRLPTIQAYQFYKKFMETYGAQGLNQFFSSGYYNFYSSLVDETRYYNRGEYVLTLKIDQGYLDDEMRRQILLWLEECLFLYSPEKYLPFVIAILRDNMVISLFSADEQRALFDLVIDWPDLSQGIVSSLKDRYLTEEEKNAEQDAAEAARQKAEYQRKLDLIQELRKKYAEESDQTFSFDKHFLDQFNYRQESQKIAACIVCEHLDKRLTEPAYLLNHKEAIHFLAVCTVLLKLGVINFQTVNTYILKIKECIDNAGDSN